MNCGSGSLRASVIVPTHGRRGSLLRLLRALASQDVPAQAFEVVVVCDGDVDGSAAAAHGLARDLPFEVRVIEQVNQGRAAARNRGVAESRGPLLIFLDDDIVPAEGLISAHISAQEAPGPVVSIGPLLPPPDGNLSLWEAWEADRLGRNHQAMLARRWKPTYRQFYSGNAAVSRSHMLDVGGFNRRFSRNEDVELAYRLHRRGVTFTGAPDALGWHYVSRSFDSFVRLAMVYGAADIDLARAGCPAAQEYGLDEYRRRPLPMRAVLQACVGRPTAYRLGVALLAALARGLNALGLAWQGRAAASLIFNLCFYHSFAQELGGRTAFKEWLRGANLAVLISDGQYFNDTAMEQI